MRNIAKSNKPDLVGRSEYNAHKALSLASYEDHLKAPTLCVKQVKYWEQSATSICSGVRREQRKADLAAANKVKGKAGGFLRSAAMKALNNLSKMVG